MNNKQIVMKQEARKMRIKNVLYLIGRPEVTKAGRFNRQSTTYQTAFLDENGKVIYGQQTYLSYGTKGVPENVIKVTRAEFQKMLNAK